MGVVNKRGVANKRLEVSLYDQTILLLESGRVVQTFSISTAIKGPGERSGSYQTPRGRHYIRAKIGQGMPSGGVFVGRRFTGEIFTPQLKQVYPERDWILTRILWLCGCEVGFNRLGQVDSMRRYIYIHGTPDSEPMGEPASIGCIRMRNSELITLFDWAPIFCPIDIFA